MKKIIAICGLVGSGKGTAAKIFEDQGYTRLSFADSLKDVVSIMFHWPRELLQGDTIESREFRENIDHFWSNKFDRPITPRYILRYFGTEVCRDTMLDSIWVDSLERKLDDYDKVIIDDCRFKIEFDFLKRYRGKLIAVERPEINPVWYTELTDSLDNILNPSVFMNGYYPDIHRSEWEWISHEVDMWFYNTDKIKFETEILDYIKNFAN